eukprot:365447-Chlamydomonas_euryale.AAC.3
MLPRVSEHGACRGTLPRNAATSHGSPPPDTHNRCSSCLPIQQCPPSILLRVPPYPKLPSHTAKPAQHPAASPPLSKAAYPCSQARPASSWECPRRKSMLGSGRSHRP